MLRLYNTLTKKVEEFAKKPGDAVALYCCGPTVYDFAHIGNFRTYTMTDFLVRTLKYLGYTVKFAMNITDVGHLTSDADSGEDKMEKGAKREGKTAWDLAKFYTEAFTKDSEKLNLLPPDVRPRATEFIKEQQAMVQTLLDKGYAYTIDDGIYFDTSKFKGYGALTGQNIDELKAGARVEPNPQKKNPTDFALWKFSYPKGRSFDPAQDAAKRHMEWDSPWGKGFPGWHIECSAMSMNVLKTDQLDIHTGGMDLIPVHHTNEIAQSEAATGKSPFVRFWVHGQFIMVDGEKMAKSKGNFYKLADIEKKGYEPLALRYLYMTAHYRAFLNFTWEALDAAQKALNELRELVGSIRPKDSSGASLSQEGKALEEKFRESVSDDLNMPRALAVMWEGAKSTIPSSEKYTLLLKLDRVLGLKLDTVKPEELAVPPEIGALMKKREELRRAKKFAEADAVRKEIEAKGFILEDTPTGYRLKKALK